jgi:hypothetical protein
MHGQEFDAEKLLLKPKYNNFEARTIPTIEEYLSGHVEEHILFLKALECFRAASNNNDRVDLKVIDFRGNVTSSFFNILARDEDIASRLSQSVSQKFHNTASSRSDFIPSNLIPYDRIAMAAYKRGLIPAKMMRGKAARYEVTKQLKHIIEVRDIELIYRCPSDKHFYDNLLQRSVQFQRAAFPLNDTVKEEVSRAFMTAVGTNKKFCDVDGDAMVANANTTFRCTFLLGTCEGGNNTHATDANLLAPSCRGNGSLHQIGLDMFHFSSPRGSPSYIKFKHVLDMSSHFYIGKLAVIFEQTTEAIRRMLSGYGLHETDIPSPSNNNQSVLLLDHYTGEKGNSTGCPLRDPKCMNRPRIYFQSEQHASPQFGRVNFDIRLCSESPNCIVWEYSDYNYRNLEDDVKSSTVLLPIMIQSPSRLSSYETHVKSLKERQYDIVFFGWITKRRKALWKQPIPLIEAHPDRTLVLKYVHHEAKEEMANAYKDAKVCLVTHAYNSTGAGEYHRLSEFARFGCVPVMENFGEEIGVESFKRCGGAVFTSFDKLMEKASEVVAEIDRGVYDGRSNSIARWWKDGIQWEKFLTTVLQ